MADIFLDSWVVSLSISDFVLTDNGPQFVCNIFAMLCADLGVKPLATTTYYLHTNGQAERLNRAIVTRPQHYVANKQQNWDTLVQLLIYAYNDQVHRGTYILLYSLVPSRTST